MVWILRLGLRGPGLLGRDGLRILDGAMRDKDPRQQQTPSAPSWGPLLFIATLVFVLAFFYWLLIYYGGVSVHHG